MIPRKLAMGAVGISLGVHALLLVAFAIIILPSLPSAEKFIVETVFSEDREQEEFTQELDLNTDPSENLNPIAGGVVTQAVGATSSPVVSQTRIETSETLKEPVLVANVGEITIPGENLLGQDLGEKAVMGETGAVVEGYGAAMSRITRELLRLMRESKVMVVWMFDESESMKDDQKEIRDQFDKIYEELGIATKKNETAPTGSSSRRPTRGTAGMQDDVLLTAVTAYGKDIHYLLENPTSDVATIRQAIDKIDIDTSGEENMCRAMRDVIAKYRVLAGRQERRLVVVLVSDESGDDGQFVEETLQEAKRANVPIYILGREAIFGYEYAHIRYTEPMYNTTHWLRVNRGPETAYPEALQWNGFRERHDAYRSGFGPFEMVRLCKETGGVFFLLPSEEENLVGAGANEKRKFDFLDMKEYQPRLGSRREYEESVLGSPKFRTPIREVIARLDPGLDKQLSIREDHYSTDPAKFRDEIKDNFDKALRAMALANQASAILEKIEPERELEQSQRWRASYDLIRAQVYAYRVRLWQYLLAADKRAKEGSQPKNPKNNIWNMRHTQELLPPDPEQVKLTKVDLEEIESQRKRAVELLEQVKKNHPGTPWANRASEELKAGYGVKFVEAYRDPNSYRPEVLVKLPKL